MSQRALRAATTAPAPASKRAAAARAGRLLPYAAWRDSGTRESQAVLLQQLAGNRATARLLGEAAGDGDAGGIRLHGETTGTYDGGQSRITGQRIRRARGCDCPADDPCLRATGTLVIDYEVDVDIRMPGVPDGLSRCQRQRVRTFLDRVLGPHEREHARRMRTYNGTTRHPFDVLGCGQDGLTSALQDRLQQVHEEEATARHQTAQALSDAIDPFERQVDLDCD